MDFSLTMMMEPGAIGTLSYAHHSLDEPAILVGMGFPLQQQQQQQTAGKQSEGEGKGER